MEEQITFSQKFALLTAAKYAELNLAISEASGYDINNSTVRYTDEIPRLAKVNIQVVDEVETYDTMCVMIITGRVQEEYPELMAGIELVDSYEPVETEDK